MKRIMGVAVIAALTLLLLASCGVGQNPNTIYILGPTPDHGWTAQAGSYAQRKADEINSGGKYKAAYLSASTGEEQVEQVQTIIANGDAAGVVFFAQSDSAKAGQEALIEQDIPFISFDRIIDGPDQHAILNASGDNWQSGAAVAYWLQQKGLLPGDTMVTLAGDDGTVTSRRQEGFEQFLTGDLSYHDKHTGQTYQTDRTWTQAEIDALCADHRAVCNWSADGARDYLETAFADIITDAKNGNGRLFIYSMDDEMTLGVLSLLEEDVLSSETKAELAELDVCISAIGGMQELYDIMDGSAEQASVADEYFDEMMSVYFSPKMMIDVIGYMEDYLNGDWTYELGGEKYEPVWIVDKNNVSQYEGFEGRAD